MMKNITLVFAAVLFGASFAMAEGPCMKIKEACEKAGFVKGGHKTGKGLYKDCLQVIKNGGTVAGVSVDPKDAADCKAKADAKKAEKSK